MSEATVQDPSGQTPELRYVQYHGSKESTYLPAIRQLISTDLSEPYSIYVYRYFLYQWGDLCFMVSRPATRKYHGRSSLCRKLRFAVPQAIDAKENLVGVVISKLEPHRDGPLRGYIAMLAVREEYRGKGIATKLVRMAIDIMIEREADEVGILILLIDHLLKGLRSLWKRKSRILRQ